MVLYGDLYASYLHFLRLLLQVQHPCLVLTEIGFVVLLSRGDGISICDQSLQICGEYFIRVYHAHLKCHAGACE